MKKLIYGTHNPSKIARVQEILKDLGVTVTGLDGIDSKIEEDGKTAEENARKKLIEYAKILGEDVLSMDTGLYFEELPGHLQPGLHVRRIPGNESASDQEVLKYYTTLISKYGGKLHGYREFSYALSTPDSHVRSFTARTKSRVFVDIPHPTILPGYPLSSLQLDPKGDHYILDAEPTKRNELYDEIMKNRLVDFIAAHSAHAKK